tara:strand:- start:818 stop:955 length:138 start_codon:yes stop_codon:yes gene_type:complete
LDLVGLPISLDSLEIGFSSSIDALLSVLGETYDLDLALGDAFEEF